MNITHNHEFKPFRMSNNFLKQVLKNNIPFQDFTDFVIGEILPMIKAKEGSEEVVSDILNAIKQSLLKQGYNLVSFDIFEKAMLDADYIVECENTIRNNRLNPDFDGDDTECENVDFGEELKACILSGDFKNSYQDYLDNIFSTVNIQL